MAGEVLGALQSEIARINDLVEKHLLAVVRGRQAEVVLIAVEQLLGDVVTFMEPEARRNRTDIVLTGDLGALPRMMADEAKLRQVLLNIMLNAIQAMERGGTITISAVAEDDRVAIRVADTGPGIDGELADLEQVFRPFHTTKADGTGLGLAICARLVKEMGGEITVTSERGEGATFIVSLPAEQARGD